MENNLFTNIVVRMCIELQAYAKHPTRDEGLNFNAKWSKIISDIPLEPDEKKLLMSCLDDYVTEANNLFQEYSFSLNRNVFLMANKLLGNGIGNVAPIYHSTDIPIQQPQSVPTVPAFTPTPVQVVEPKVESSEEEKDEKIPQHKIPVILNGKDKYGVFREWCKKNIIRVQKYNKNVADDKQFIPVKKIFEVFSKDFEATLKYFKDNGDPFSLRSTTFGLKQVYGKNSLSLIGNTRYLINYQFNPIISVSDKQPVIPEQNHEQEQQEEHVKEKENNQEQQQQQPMVDLAAEKRITGILDNEKSKVSLNKTLMRVCTRQISIERAAKMWGLTPEIIKDQIYKDLQLKRILVKFNTINAKRSKIKLPEKFWSEDFQTYTMSKDHSAICLKYEIDGETLDFLVKENLSKK